MLEIVFNELSFTERAASRQYAGEVYRDFFSLVDMVSALKIAPVRIRTTFDLANETISEEYFTLKDWFKTLSHDVRQRYLGYIVQDPIIVKNPYFTYYNNDCVGFGYAFIEDLVSISYSTNHTWIASQYTLTKDFLPHDGAGNIIGEVITDEVTVNHCLSVEGRINHELWIRNAYQTRQDNDLKTVRQENDFDIFWEKKGMLFQWLEFASEVNQQVRLYGSFKNDDLKRAINYLSMLNQHLVSVNAGNAEFDNLPGDNSNDSEATLNKYGVERIFTCPDGIQRTFSLHVKLGDVRIYLIPRQADGKYIVGYIGMHLRTVKFNK